jgi:DNA-binding IclR family transcriptional regulator
MSDDPIAEAATSTGTRIRSVARAAQLLMLIAALPESERRVRRLADELGTSVPTAYHLLNTLVDAKLLARDEHKQYRFGSAVDVIAAVHAQQAVPPPELVAPLRSIIDSTGESAYFSAWRGETPVVLAHLAGTHAVQVTNLRPGYGGAATTRASGKVLLAFADAGYRERYLALHPLEARTNRSITDPEVFSQELEQVRRNGYACEVEEFCVGVACLSVPVWSSGVLVGCYTISAPVERYRSHKWHYLARLRAAVEEFRDRARPVTARSAS